MVDVVQQANLRMFIKKTTHDHAISESRREVRAVCYIRGVLRPSCDLTRGHTPVGEL